MTSRRRRSALVAWTTGLLLLAQAPAARAEHMHWGLFAIGLPIGHGVMLPGYVSTLYYAAKADRPMPLGWAAPNLVFSAAAGGLGVGILAYGVTHPEDRGPGVPAMVTAGASLLVGASLVTVGSVLQMRRPQKVTTSFDPTKLSVAPLSSKRGVNGLIIAGRF